MTGRVPEDPAVVIDGDGAITVWSAGARRLLGCEPAEIVGRRATDLLATDLLATDLRAADLPGSARRHLANGHRWASEAALRHRDGNRVVVRLQGTPLTDADHNRLWLVTRAAPAHAAGPVEPWA